MEYYQRGLQDMIRDLRILRSGGRISGDNKGKVNWFAVQKFRSRMTERNASRFLRELQNKRQIN